MDTPLRPIEILLIEDNLSDIHMTQKALADSKVINRLSVLRDGVVAMAYLKREGSYENAPRPDLILLDLSLPNQDGREVLAAIKQDPVLRRIPVVALSPSQSEKEVLATYNLHANCYITKPVDLDQFLDVVESIREFWLGIVKLPSADHD